MKYWYRLVLLLDKIIFRNSSYLGLIDDIKGLTFEEIKTQLKGMKVTIFNRTDEGYYARFTNFHTEYILSFTPSDKVKNIELEYWKDLNVKFGNEMITQ